MSLSESIQILFNNPKHADLKIRCHDKTFLAHKCIVTSQSIFFYDAVDLGRLKSHDGRTIIDVKDHSPEIVRAVLMHLYGMNDLLPHGEQSPAKFYARVYLAAWDFNAPRLKADILTALADVAGNGAEGAWHCFEAVKWLSQVSNVNTYALKDVLFPAINRHLQAIFSENKSNHDTLYDVPHLAADLVCYQVQVPNWIAPKPRSDLSKDVTHFNCKGEWCYSEFTLDKRHAWGQPDERMEEGIMSPRCGEPVTGVDVE